MSPQTPIAYCPWGRRTSNSIIAYMLPNQEANLIMTSDSNLSFVIFNISTGVEYVTNIADKIGRAHV